MDINDILLTVRYIANKDAKGYITSTEFNKTLLPQAQRSYQAFLLGQPEQFQPGRPIAKVEIGDDEIVMQKLAPFIMLPTTLAINGSGQAAYPANYVYPYGMYTSDLKTSITWAMGNVVEYINSSIDDINTYPVYQMAEGKFQFYPITLGSVKLTYLRLPVDGLWNFTLDVNGIEVYNAGTSVQIEWNQIDYYEIIARMLRMVGVNLSAPAVIQLANEVKNVGQ